MDNKKRIAKKALAMQMIVIAIIAIIVLVVLIVLLIEYIHNADQGANSTISDKKCPGTLRYSCLDDEKEYGTYGIKWEGARMGQICCVKNKKKVS